MFHSASESADSLLTVSRAMKVGPEVYSQPIMALPLTMRALLAVEIQYAKWSLDYMYSTKLLPSQKMLTNSSIETDIYYLH